jgi:alpha-1,6-mannosyltransferase
VAALKLAAGLAVLGLAALSGRLAAERGLNPPRAVAFVALNPLVLVHVVGGAHNDALAMLLALAGVAALAVALEASAGVALLAALAVKLSAAFVAPFALLAELRPASRSGAAPARPARFLAGAALAAAAIGLAAYLGFGWGWLHALGLAGENQGRTSHMSIPTTFARVVGLDEEGPRAAALALYAALLAYLLAWTWRGGDWVRAAAWAGLGLLLATSWLLPWYLVLALPLAAISRDRPLQLLTLALTAYQLGARIPL